MVAETNKLDETPLNKFHLRITALTFGANFSDGYHLATIAIILPMISKSWGLNGFWQGALGSATLFGLFFGAIGLGWLGDRIGRQKIYLFDFIFITIFSFVQYFAYNPAELFIFRFLIGVGIGADYAIGPALVSEFVPRRFRGSLLGALTALWTFGYVVAYVIGEFLTQLGPETWRWLAASSGIPAIIVLLLRIGTPESPRWLLSKGRVKEAQDIINKYVPNADLRSFKDTSQKNTNKCGYSTLFKKYRIRTTFCLIFYSCNVLVYFAMFTYLPFLLNKMGRQHDFEVTLILNLFLLFGGIAGIWLINLFTRRTFTAGSFLILTVCMTALAIWPTGPFIYITVFFVVFTFVMSAFSDVTQVYPAELFPTEIRGRGVGLANGVSRLGSVVGTFFLPISVAAVGVAPSLGWLAAVSLIGAVVTLAWAPETGQLNLDEASSV